MSWPRIASPRRPAAPASRRKGARCPAPAVPPLPASGPAPPAPPHPTLRATLSDAKDPALTLAASLLGEPPGLKNIISYAAVLLAGRGGGGTLPGGAQEKTRAASLAWTSLSDT